MTKMEFTFQKIITVFLLGFLLVFSAVSYALPFTIVPMSGTALPTSIAVGSSAQAYYTVINNTGSTRVNNYVRFLPPFVSQVTAGTYPNTCGTLFTLAPNGQSGDSCTLELTVSGAVDANDPDPEHHLFVCFPGGLTCAGTLYPLNVTVIPVPPTLLSITVTPSSPTIFVNSTQQFTAIGNYSDGSTVNLTDTAIWISSTPAVATISSTGLATGISPGTTNITASYDGITSAVDVATVSKRIVSIAITPTSATLGSSQTKQFTATATYSDSTTANISSSATWTSSNPGVASINSSGLATAIAGGVPDTTNITASSQSITSNIAVITVVMYLYIDSESDYQIAICSTAGGGISNCNSTSAYNFYAPVSPAINPAHTLIFNITTGTEPGPYYIELVTCPIAGNGVNASSCVISLNLGTSNPSAILINKSGTYAFISNAGSSSIRTCKVSGSTLTNCASTTLSDVPRGIALNPANTILYVAAPAGEVYNCAIGTNETLTCGNAGYIGTPSAVAIDPTNTYAYIGDNDDYIYVCLVGANGNFTNCTQQTGVAHNNINAMAMDTPGQALFILDGVSNFYSCPITNSGATVPTCNEVNISSYVNSPSGLTVS